ncbi:hypothetical protein E2C01_071323 [Portunus trituberculatus]|uniref:Uncharacterized protein n=1 Tax=Portunus trituberculatus TaxID=210409 RepID=A0A5B7I4U5_PORTR|nr:hypothetical protein [Portunus trituberculatus]
MLAEQRLAQTKYLKGTITLRGSPCGCQV